ncbi:MAG: TonB-dependent receptor [Gammaproteobacteria bacterium]|nr:TonB-dependent receptor [Gammaproteobacteria bacterium]
MRYRVHPLSLAISLVLSSSAFATTGESSPAATDSTVTAAISPTNSTAKTTDTVDDALKVVVKAKRASSRNNISAETGGSSYHITAKDIASMPQGDSTPLNQVLLQAPGVAQDSFGQVHVRGDHGDLQYRINGTILPESISGFGQTLDPSFMQSVNVLTGALPAQYGDRTAGVVDIQTKTGAVANTGSIGVTVGSNDSREVTGSVSGSKDNLTYYVSGSFLSNDLGIENPTASNDPIHDHTNQFKGFGYFSYLLGDVSRVSLIVGSTDGRFQIPNRPDQTQNYQLAGVSNYPSANLNESQNEITRYGVLTFQSSIGDRFDYQLSASSRYTSVNFNPDNIGDLIYTGVASTIARSGWENGLQADGTYRLDDRHTIRFGGVASAERLDSRGEFLTFPADANGNQTSDQPIAYQSKDQKVAYLEGLYLQDEWKATDKLTVNYGGRFDHVDAYVTASQFSPRINAVYELTPQTTLHAGYARYFTPPPTELVTTDTIAASQGTTSAPAGTLNDPVKAERSDYYDFGVSHKLTSKLTIGLDSYYKKITNMLDEGQFGSALLYTPFNYAQGKVYGVELTANYHDGNFSAYANLARATALGKNIISSQYTFDANELAYIANHWIHLDHDQTLSASAGMSYRWLNTTYSADAIYGSGLRKDFANTEHLPDYFTMNLGASHTFNTVSLGQLEGRVSIVNLFDKVYEIRDGSGVGVGAPQFGARRGYYLGVTKKF